MASLNYTRRLSNVESRKFDQDLNESVISKSFSARQLPEDLKYLMESMRPIDQKYNQKTLQAAQNIETHLERELSLHFSRAYRTQGSVKTDTNIKVYSDFDLLTIVDRYYFQEVMSGDRYTFSDPDSDIKELRKQATKILKGIYDEVDEKNEKCITVFNKNLRRKVDVVFAYWYNTVEYERTHSEIIRGIHLYKFPNGPRKSPPDFPFSHIHLVNLKGDSTLDGSRRAIRLLKNLKADSDPELKEVKSFHLTSIVHDMYNSYLQYTPGKELDIAQAVSFQLARVIDDVNYRRSIMSPNKQEPVIPNDDIVPNLISLKKDLDLLIQDCRADLQSWALQKAITTY